MDLRTCKNVKFRINNFFFFLIIIEHKLIKKKPEQFKITKKIFKKKKNFL